MKKTMTIVFMLICMISFAQKKENDTTYFLAGKMKSFQILYAAIANPDDVTNNQKKKLLDWIEQGMQPVIIDSVNTKKPKKP